MNPAENPRTLPSKAHFMFKSLEEMPEQNLFDWMLFDGAKVGLF